MRLRVPRWIMKLPPMARIVVPWALVLAAGAFLLQWLQYRYIAQVFSPQIYITVIGTARGSCRSSPEAPGEMGDLGEFTRLGDTIPPGLRAGTSVQPRRSQGHDTHHLHLRPDLGRHRRGGNHRDHHLLRRTAAAFERLARLSHHASGAVLDSGRREAVSR